MWTVQHENISESLMGVAMIALAAVGLHIDTKLPLEVKSPPAFVFETKAPMCKIPEHKKETSALADNQTCKNNSSEEVRYDKRSETVKM